MTKDEFIKEIESWTVIELHERIEAIKEKFGVTEAPVAAAEAAAPEAAEEEKSQFDVVIKEAGSNKIAVIKVIKSITGLGLKDAKELAETPGKTIKEGVDKATAEDIKAQLESQGAKAELK